MPTDLLGDFYRRSRQRKIATGFGLTQNESAGALDASLLHERQLAERSQQFSLQKRQLDISEQNAKDQAAAARMGGYGQLAQLPITYLAAKSLLGGFGGGAAAGAQAQIGAAGTAGGAQGSLMLPGAAGTGLAEGAGPASVIGASAPAALPSAGGALLANAGPIGGLMAANYLGGKALQPTMNKIGLPTAGKFGTYAGLPGAMLGGSIDISKKVLGGVVSGLKHLF